MENVVSLASCLGGSHAQPGRAVVFRSGGASGTVYQIVGEAYFHQGTYMP
jgi:hypothetical protein